jgi:hypothetical protein
MNNLSMNNRNVSDGNGGKCLLNFVTIEYYIGAVSNIFGSLFNFICVIVFIKILRHERQKSNMFRYFLTKSINDCILFIINSFVSIYYCIDSCEIKYSYWMQVWYIYFYYYGAEILFLSSGILEMCASIDCFLLLSKRLPFLKKKIIFYIIVISFYILNSLLSVVYIFRFEIIELKSPNTTKIRYLRNNTHFYLTKMYNYWIIFLSIQRDYIVILIQIIFNILILFIMKKITKSRKININKVEIKGTVGVNKKRLLNMAEKTIRAEQNMARLIIIQAINCFIFHSPMSINILLKYFKIDYFKCYDSIFYDLMVISYVSPFFIFILFNRTFRSNIYSLFSFF